MKRQHVIIAIDFDGTIVEHKYPEIGAPIKHALETIKELQERGHLIILWTMRSGKELAEAVEYLQKNGVQPWGINQNPEQDWSTSPKAYAQIYIDDAALGCPLEQKGFDRPMVYWPAVRKHLQYLNLLANSSGQDGADKAPGKSGV